MNGLDAVFLVGGNHQNVARSPSESGHFGPQGRQVKGLEDLDELRDEVGAVLAAQGGLEYQPPVAGVVAAGGGEDGDLVGLRGNGFEVGDLGCLLF